MQPETSPVDEAARWLAAIPHSQRPRPLIPYLQSHYSLSAVQAVAVIREANLIAARSH